MTPDPGGHRPQCPCAQGRTCAEQEEAQGAAPAQTKDEIVGRATTNGRTTKQEGEGWPTPTPTEAAPCTPQPTHQARTPRLVTRTATSCARGGDVPGQQQGRGGTARDKPWQPQQGYDQKEMPQPTPPTLRPKTCLKEIIPEECNRQRASRAQNTRAFKQQVFDVAPPVFSVCLSTRGGPKIRTRGENTFLAQTAPAASSGGPKVKQMISNQMRRP